MSRDDWTVSPQQIDPLSWFTRPLVPVAFALLTVVVGLATTFFQWRLVGEPWLDVLAIALIASACVLVQISTRPLRPTFGPRQALAPLALAVGGLALATLSAIDSDTLVQYWWASIGVGCVVAALGPFSTARQVLVYGTGLTVVTAACGYVAFAPDSNVWPGLSVTLIAGCAGVIATVATATFCYVVVSRTRLLLRGAEPPTQEGPSDELARRVERRTLARLGSRVAPFLEGIADAGEVTAADRALAGQLARQLRSDLVSQVNRTWLDSVALFGRIYVVDPDRLADRMNPAQRTALRALLLSVTTNPGAAAGSLFIELRGEPDGSTAVALSLDFSLPEGRRAMLLAPYYLTLQTTVDSLTWDPSRDLLRFQLPAQGSDT
ncbi:hypothetical protein GCM10027413_27030 [Conyzicola nivalis]|uniref:Uncharacterized protein n=1 Tax=Conyzicola nivalis TaxID=1477021 RepID=A0A916WNT0_9MICO|nr:hypothetical protein [Conyzicola nivalis]GGB15380.1 hypothetical protein GCM10010979_32480 [Conyzicola nivalis]